MIRIVTISFFFIVTIINNGLSQSILDQFQPINHIKQDLNIDYFNEIWLKSADINNDDALGYAQRASEKISMGYIDEALEDIKRSIEIFPEYDYPYILLGICKGSQDSIQLAIEAFHTAIKIDSLNPVSHYYLGNLNFAQHRFDDAKTSFENALNIDESFFPSYQGIGNIYLALNKIERAKQKFNKAISIEPNFIDSRFNLALIEYYRKNVNKTSQILDQIKAINPEFAPAYFLKGMIFLQKEEIDIALIEWEKAIELDNNNTIFKLYLGSLYAYRKNFDKSIHHLFQALDGEGIQQRITHILSGSHNQNIVNSSAIQILIYKNQFDSIPDNIAQYLNEYICNFTIGNYPQSITALRNAYRLDISQPITNLFLGIISNIERDYDDAERYLIKTSKHLPDIPEINYQLGYAMFHQQKYAETILFFDKYISDLKHPSYAYKFRGISYAKLNRNDEAILDLSTFKSIAPLDHVVHEQLVTLLLRTRQLDKAISIYDEWIEYEGPNISTLFDRANCKYLNKDYQGALDDLNQIGEIELMHNGDILYLRGIVKIQLNLKKEALKDLKKLVKMIPFHIDAITNIGKIYYDQGKYNAALKEYNQVLELNSNASTVYYLRGLLYFNQKEFEKACADFNKAKELGYDVPENAMKHCDNLNQKEGN